MPLPPAKKRLAEATLLLRDYQNNAVGKQRLTIHQKPVAFRQPMDPGLQKDDYGPIP